MSADILRILVGTDFSEPSAIALGCAARLADKLSVEITVAYAFDPLPLTGAGAMAPAAAWAVIDVSEGQRKLALREFAKLGETELAGVAHSTVTLAHPNAAIALCDHAREIAADLILVGTHGRGGATRLLLGSVAEQVIRHAPCSVLVARDGGTAPTFPAHILLATDFSTGANAATDLTVKLAPTTNPRVRVVHVRGESLWREATDAIDSVTKRNVESMMWDKLNHLAHEHFGAGATAELLTGDAPATAIVQRAREIAADLIVVATHGRTGLPRLLIGSVAERVAREAHCSVLVARA
jgi:nucleotide-binding universal stress UspA family protein